MYLMPILRFKFFLSEYARISCDKVNILPKLWYFTCVVYQAHFCLHFNMCGARLPHGRNHRCDRSTQNTLEKYVFVCRTFIRYATYLPSLAESHTD